MKEPTVTYPVSDHEWLSVKVLAEKDARIAELEAENERLQTKVAALEAENNILKQLADRLAAHECSDAEVGF